MNGTGVVAAPPGLWSEARNAEGRVYYYNTVTKATQWTKPPELMSPAEVRIVINLNAQHFSPIIAASPRKSALERVYS